MIVYQSTKDVFLDDVLSNSIESTILDLLHAKTGKTVGKSEIRSWKESMRFMGALLHDSGIPSTAGVAIEYHIPQTSKRIDFILTGQNEQHEEHAILIELKQWQTAKMTEKDAMVVTRFERGEAEVCHPSYQAWSYAALLQGFNETVNDENIQLKPCAYLHNYEPDGVIQHEFYSDYLERAPVFLQGKDEQEKLRAFIKRFIKYGDEKNIMVRIDSGRIRPSKNLADSMANLLKGNQEFIMIDDQKLVFETAMALAKHSTVETKNVLIVEGGPGTGKSVVAVNLLVQLTKIGLLAQYVTKNAAPRTVYESKLTGHFRKSEISNFFAGSGSFVNAEKHIFDALIVDEAHRLTEKSGMFKNLGENQVKEIIDASKCSVFFLDEDQRVTFQDVGELDEIEYWAKQAGATVQRLKLSSQFRCNGSDGYLAWLDDVLQIRETANVTIDHEDYDIRVVDSPNELKDIILEKNKINNKARIVAGYCWEWKSKKDPNIKDIVIPEHGFLMKWNLASDGNLWILSPSSVSEAGCIHTCQGLEVDYIGVIIGSDLIVRDGVVVTDGAKRAKSDKSISGFKTLLKTNPVLAKERADVIIKNTYRTLMTRGMKGCYLYFTDSETQRYFKKRLG